MNEQIEAAARAEAERREWPIPEGTPYINGVRPTDVQEWVEDAFARGAAWQAAQPRTVSAEECKAIVKACEPWTTFTAEDGHPSSTTLTAETIAARVLEAAGLTVAEAGEVR
jgi:hypothetical protein